MLKKFLLVIIAFTALSMAGWYAYDYWWESRDWDYGLDEAKSELVENYKENKSKFQDLSELCLQIKTLELFEFGENDAITFRVEDSTKMKPDFSDNVVNYDGPVLDFPWYTQMGGKEYNQIQDFIYEDPNIVNVFANGEWVRQRNWWLSFYGDRNDELIPKLLAYHNLDLALVYQLFKLIKKVNCKGIDIEDGLVRVLYRGAFFTGSLCYVIPLNNQAKEKEWTRIDNDIYWMVGENGLWCELTDWSM